MSPSGPQTLALAIGLGSLVSLLCVRMRIPAILPLLITGLIVGRSGAGLVDGDALGSGLTALIAVAIGLLVFEGALHLDRQELAKAPRAVWGLLTVGAAITWGGAALLARHALGMSWSAALVLGALLIVTGPTVVQPILRRRPLKPNLHAVLSAEAVLIDPIGVVLTVSTLELALVAMRGVAEGSLTHAAGRYATPLLAGVIVGAVVGGVAVLAMRRLGREGRPDLTQMNLFAMAACMIAVGAGEWAAPEAGLVASTLAGVMMANVHMPGVRDLRWFKEQLSGMFVGTLFVLLASRVELNRLGVLGWEEAVFVAGLIFVVRPLAVGVATLRSSLGVRERLFVAFLAPRGIVAASIASIAAAQFIQLGASVTQDGASADVTAKAAAWALDGARIETTAFLVIFVTVAIGGSFAGVVARLLGVGAGAPNGLLMIGAHRLNRELAALLVKEGVPVRLVDRNAGHVAAAVEAGLDAEAGDATDVGWLEDDVFTNDIGWVFAATDNRDVDTIVSRWAAERLGDDRAFRWMARADAKAAGRRTLAVNRSLRWLLSDLESDRAVVQTWTGEHKGAIPFAAIDANKKLRLLPAGVSASEIPKDAHVIGLIRREPSAGAD